MHIGRFVIVRSYAAGVHVGVLQAKYIVGSRFAVDLTESSRIWNWSGANTLDEIAIRGAGEESKISEAAPEKTVAEVIEILPVTPEAEKNLRRSRWVTRDA